MTDGFAADIAAAFSDLAGAGGTVAVTLGSTTVQGILDEEGREMFQSQVGGLTGDEIAVTIITGSLPGLANGSVLTVDGAPRVVRDHLKTAGGRLTRILCGVQ